MAAKPTKPPAEPRFIRKAFTIERAKGGWVFVTITYDSDGLVNIERTEPDLKSLVIERFKIASFKYWSSIG